MDRRFNRGSAYIEYFILATVVALAALIYFNGGFKKTQTDIDAAFDGAVGEILAP